MAKNNTNKLHGLSRICDRADEEFRVELNKQYRTGQKVRVRWGKGWLEAVVGGPSLVGNSRTVKVKTAAGKFHHKHYLAVEIV